MLCLHCSRWHAQGHGLHQEPGCMKAFSTHQCKIPCFEKNGLAGGSIHLKQDSHCFSSAAGGKLANWSGEWTRLWLHWSSASHLGWCYSKGFFQYLVCVFMQRLLPHYQCIFKAAGHMEILLYFLLGESRLSWLRGGIMIVMAQRLFLCVIKRHLWLWFIQKNNFFI